MDRAWYPNRLQWCIIWASVLIAAHIWLDLHIGYLWDGPSGTWGLDGYFYKLRYRRHVETPLAVTVLAIGTLLVWQASAWRKRR
jgi:hypothetical protein